MKKLQCIGTRPRNQISSNNHYLNNNKNIGFSPIVIATGQHTNLLYDVFSFFNITPNYELSIRHSQLLKIQGQLTQT